MSIPIAFRYRIERRGAVWNAVFPELPEADFSAASAAQVQAEAPARIQAGLAALLSSGFVPFTKPHHAGEGLAVLPLSAQAKCLLIERAWALGVQAAHLARALGITRQEAARYFDLMHPTKIDALQLAAAALGMAIVLDMRTLPQGPSPKLFEKPKRRRRKAAK